MASHFMACGEAEKACEYVHGSVSYGAFTYAMAQALRDTASKSGRTLSYDGLLHKAAEKLSRLGYTQRPEILGHDKQKNAAASFGQRAAKPATKKLIKPRSTK